MKKHFISYLFFFLTHLGFSQKIPYGSNCYKYKSLISQRDPTKSNFYIKIGLYTIPPNYILKKFYDGFKSYKKGVHIYQQQRYFNPSPICFNGYLFSNIIINDPKINYKDRYLIGHCLRNMCLIKNPNLNFDQYKIINVESVFLKDHIQGNCCDFFEPIFFEGNNKYWIERKAIIEKELIILTRCLGGMFAGGGFVSFRSFLLSEDRQSYIDIRTIKKILGIRPNDSL